MEGMEGMEGMDGMEGFILALGLTGNSTDMPSARHAIRQPLRPSKGGGFQSFLLAAHHEEHR